MTVAQSIASDPARSVWVSASAGTGKTKVLVDRLTRLLLDGADPSRLLCLTFTKAAAAEMRNRLSDVLGRWARLSDADLEADLHALTGTSPDDAVVSRARRLFTRVLDTPGGLRLMTIHAFCQSVLRRFPIEAGIPAHFSVMDERTTSELMALARERVLVAAHSDPASSLGEYLREITVYGHEEDVDGLLAGLSSERTRLTRLLRQHGDADGVAGEVARVLGVDPMETEDGLIATACADGAFDASGLSMVSGVMRAAGKKDQAAGAVIAAWLAASDRRSMWADYLRVFFTEAGLFRARLCYGDTEKALPAAPGILVAEAHRVNAVRQRIKSLRIFRATSALLRLGVAVLGEYGRCKSARSVLDYDDLVQKVQALLLERSTRDWVLYKLDGGLDHVLIDEAQDTNPEQWNVVAALADEFFVGESDRARTVFAVGDPKQSIYGFQRADPAGFERMRQSFSGQCESIGQNWQDVSLDTSFRSVACVLDAVDAVFASPSAQPGVVTDGIPMHHIAHRQGHGGVVEVWPLPDVVDAPPAPEWVPATQYQLEPSLDRRLASVIAGQVRRWLDTGEMLESQGRPVRAGDVLVLVRRRTPFVGALVRAFKDNGVPVAGADRMVLTDQIAVMDLLALGRFLVLPEDDLTLATVLKSPLVGLDEDQLFALCYDRKGSVWSALVRMADADPVFRHAYERLSSLLSQSDRERPYELFSGILGAGGGRAQILARLGPDAADPLDEFLSLAMAYERDHIPSLQGFLHWMESGDAEVKRDSEHGVRDEVRIMTVHGAKGLQAPIVFLPDTTQVPTRGPGLLWPTADGVPLWSPRRDLDDDIAAAARLIALDEQDREYRRLLYVAMTRAEDRMYVCGWPSGKTVAPESWYGLITDGLAGVAQPLSIDLTVVSSSGWSGNGLRLVTPQQVPVTPKTRLVAVDQVALPDFLQRSAPAEPAPTSPLMPSRPMVEEPAVHPPFNGVDPGGMRRGRIIHRLLELLPDTAADNRLAACRRFLANPVHGLDFDEQTRIATEVLAVLDDPRFAAVFGPDSYAEVPVVGKLGSYAVSAQVDRLVIEQDRVLIVDYKSNRPPPKEVARVPEIYLHQMSAYRDLLAEVYPGRKVVCALLWTFTAQWMPLDDALLDSHRSWLAG